MEDIPFVSNLIFFANKFMPYVVHEEQITKKFMLAEVLFSKEEKS